MSVRTLTYTGPNAPDVERFLEALGTFTYRQWDALDLADYSPLAASAAQAQMDTPIYGPAFVSAWWSLQEVLRLRGHIDAQSKCIGVIHALILGDRLNERVLELLKRPALDAGYVF